ncbi:MAG: EamA family transporter [Deltaproteobacteria bacterium]|jgi:drug/metabolite transporter (DMT)-like permease|nr:EamA family transporter [Deltaproteobacteria bacterium]
MSLLAFTIWMANISLDTAGQLSFKAAAVNSSAYSGLAHWRDMVRRLWIWMGVAFYIGEFVCWVSFLSLVPLSVGVMLASINIVVIMVAGRLLFGERLTGWRVAGMLLITAGVAIVGLGGL